MPRGRAAAGPGCRAAAGYTASRAYESPCAAHGRGAACARRRFVPGCFNSITEGEPAAWRAAPCAWPCDAASTRTAGCLAFAAPCRAAPPARAARVPASHAVAPLCVRVARPRAVRVGEEPVPRRRVGYARWRPRRPARRAHARASRGRLPRGLPRGVAAAARGRAAAGGAGHGGEGAARRRTRNRYHRGHAAPHARGARRFARCGPRPR